MKKIFIFHVILVLSLLSIIPSYAQKTTFDDISGHWAEDAIISLTEKGIISGYPDGSFKPDNNVSRAEAAK